MQFHLIHAHIPLLKKTKKTKKHSHSKEVKTIPGYKCTENLACV